MSIRKIDSDEPEESKESNEGVPGSVAVIRGKKMALAGGNDPHPIE